MQDSCSSLLMRIQSTITRSLRKWKLKMVLSRRVKFILGSSVCMIGLLLIFLSIPIPQEQYDSIYTIKGCESSPKPFPPIIHQIWLNYSAPHYPKEWEAWVDHCRVMNKDQNITLWSTAAIDKFLSEEYPWILPTYNGYKYNIQKVDAARLFLLYHFGGMYIDLDMGCVQPFSDITRELRKYDIMLGRGATFGVSNHIMFAKPRHPYLRLAIDNLIAHDHSYGLPLVTIMYSAGPAFLSTMLRKYKCKEQVFVFPPEPGHNKYYLNYHSGTWHTWDAGFIRGLRQTHRLLKRITTWN